MDIGDWGSVIFKQAPPHAFDAASGGRGGSDGPVRAMVESFCFVIEPWNAKNVEAELRKRGLTPVADNDGKGFESFRVKDPDGFDLADRQRQRPREEPPDEAGERDAVGRRRRSSRPAGRRCGSTTSRSASTNYKKSVSFYCNLLGWKHDVRRGQPERADDRRRRRHHHPRRQSARPELPAATRAPDGSITSRSASRRGTPTP